MSGPELFYTGERIRAFLAQLDGGRRWFGYTDFIKAMELHGLVVVHEKRAGCAAALVEITESGRKRLKLS